MGGKEFYIWSLVYCMALFLIQVSKGTKLYNNHLSFHIYQDCRIKTTQAKVKGGIINVHNIPAFG